MSIFKILCLSFVFVLNLSHSILANQDPQALFLSSKSDNLCQQLRNGCQRVLCLNRLDDATYRTFEKFIEQIRKDAKNTELSLKNYIQKKRKILQEIAGFSETPAHLRETLNMFSEKLELYQEELRKLIQSENPNLQSTKLLEGAIDFVKEKMEDLQSQLNIADSTLKQDGNESILLKLSELKQLDSAHFKTKQLLENLDNTLWVLSKLINQKSNSNIKFLRGQFERKNFDAFTESGFFEFLLPRSDFISEYKNAGPRSNENYFLIRNYVAIGNGKFKRLNPDRRLSLSTDLTQSIAIESFTLSTEIFTIEGVKKDLEIFFSANPNLNANSIQVRPPEDSLGKP